MFCVALVGIVPEEALNIVLPKHVQVTQNILCSHNYIISHHTPLTLSQTPHSHSHCHVRLTRRHTDSSLCATVLLSQWCSPGSAPWDSKGIINIDSYVNEVNQEEHNIAEGAVIPVDTMEIEQH